MDQLLSATPHGVLAQPIDVRKTVVLAQPIDGTPKI